MVPSAPGTSDSTAGTAVAHTAGVPSTLTENWSTTTPVLRILTVADVCAPGTTCTLDGVMTTLPAIDEEGTSRFGGEGCLSSRFAR